MYKTHLSRTCLLPSSVTRQLSARWLHKSYYEVLNVKIDCSEKEIRDSFIKLSKAHHPDTSRDQKSAATFQRIMEAYRVLSKPDLRKSYDVDMMVKPIYSKTGYAKASDYPDVSHQKQYTQSSSNYYGIDGVQKWSNGRIMLAILCFAGFGVALQAIAIKCSFVFKRDQLDQASMRAHKWHSEVRSEVEKNDRDAQLERVLKNMKREL